MEPRQQNITSHATTSWEGDFDALPGGTLIRDGLNDLRNDVASVERLLVLIGAPRLRRLGFDIPHYAGDPERELYDLLPRTAPRAAHARYNAFIRTLVSFERAAECVRP
jgi:hypothetical protein